MDDMGGDQGVELDQKVADETLEPKERKVSAREIHNLVTQQNYRCALTGWELSPEDAVIDHMMPLSRGGSHAIENLHVVHSMVNTAKGTLTVEKFVEMCIAVADHSRC